MKKHSHPQTYTFAASALLASVALAWAIDGGTGPAPSDYFRAAPRLVQPEKAAIFAAAKAGQRVIAAGDYGVVLLSDDGASFRQAKVPTRAPLTSVFFIDGQRGWAAGHDGTILMTGDGGENWVVQRENRGEDQVLMSIWFENEQHGLAVGQFGLALETNDGGRNWQERSLINGEAGEKHLQQLVPGEHGLLFAAAEAGTILRSEDAGRHWEAVQTDNKGSFWTGLALHDGSMLMAGMRGHLYRSDDHGRHWHEVSTGTQQSLTGIVQQPDGLVHVVGLSGVSLVSKDGGRSFSVSTRQDRAAMTSLVSAGGSDIAFSASGQIIRD